MALSGADLSKLMDTMVEKIASTLRVELCKILKLNLDESEFLLAAGAGWKKGLVGEATLETGADSQAGYTLIAGKPVVVSDFETETRFSGPNLLFEHGARSGVSVFIEGPNRPFGVLGAHSTKLREFTVDDINFLQASANVLALAIKQRHAQEAIKSSEERFRTFSEEASFEGIIIHDDGLILDVNSFI